MASNRRSRSNRKPKAAATDDSLSATAQTAPRQKTGNVAVLGAGADYVYGVPMVSGLLSELANFTKAEGKPIHDALRRKLPHIRFTFEKFTGDTSQNFVSTLFSGDRDDIKHLRSSVEKLRANTNYRPVGNMLQQLCDMADRNQLSEEDLRALADAHGGGMDMGSVEPIRTLGNELDPVASHSNAHIVPPL